MRDPAFVPRVEREAAALRVLAENGIEAPEVFEQVGVEGRPGLVMERVEGEDLLSVLGRRPYTLVAAGRAMGITHAALHECIAPAELPDLREELRGRIEVADALPDDLRAVALDVLDTL